MRVYPPINHQLLDQAAAAAGDDVWTKFPSLRQWIEGSKLPTLNQLAEFARQVHIPFGFFFLDKLPPKQNTVPLFRSNRNTPDFNYSFELSETIRTIQRRQEWLTDYFYTEGYEELQFVGSFGLSETTITVANNIRHVLQLPVSWSQTLINKDAALKYLIEKIENKRIFVAISGVLGNSARNLNPEEFKGFVLTNKWAPYIFINGKDFPGAKLFTLMHELAHIWMGKTAALDIENFQPPNTDEEKFCNEIAAELLVPKDELQVQWRRYSNSQNHLQLLERYFKVSQVVIARRLLDISAYTQAEFFAFYNRYKAEWDARGDNDGGGGSFYNNQNYRVGKAFFNTVSEAVSSGKLLYTDAYKLTNLYGNTFHKYLTTFDN
jgi:Zn-dependent peptidase ImmA (M78 family)